MFFPSGERMPLPMATAVKLSTWTQPLRARVRLQRPADRSRIGRGGRASAVMDRRRENLAAFDYRAAEPIRSSSRNLFVVPAARRRRGRAANQPRARNSRFARCDGESSCSVDDSDGRFESLCVTRLAAVQMRAMTGADTVAKRRWRDAARMMTSPGPLHARILFAIENQHLLDQARASRRQCRAIGATLCYRRQRDPGGRTRRDGRVVDGGGLENH